METDIIPGLSFFSTPCELGTNGVEKVIGNGKLSEYESQGLDALKAELKDSIDKGIEFVQQNK